MASLDRCSRCGRSRTVLVLACRRCGFADWSGIRATAGWGLLLLGLGAAGVEGRWLITGGACLFWVVWVAMVLVGAGLCAAALYWAVVGWRVRSIAPAWEKSEAERLAAERVAALQREAERKRKEVEQRQREADARLERETQMRSCTHHWVTFNPNTGGGEQWQYGYRCLKCDASIISDTGESPPAHGL